MDRSQVTVYPGRWSSGLLDCHQDPVGYCEALLCTHCQIRYQRNRLEKGTTDIEGGECFMCIMNPFALFVFSILTNRSEVREKFGIAGSWYGDCCIDIWCHSCSVAQAHREMCYRGVYPGGVITSPPRNEPMGDPAHRLPKRITPFKSTPARKVSILNTNLTAASGLLMLAAVIMFGIAPGTRDGSIEVAFIQYRSNSYSPGHCSYTFNYRQCYTYRGGDDGTHDNMFELSGLLSYAAVACSGVGLAVSFALNVMGLDNFQECISATAVLVVRLLKVVMVLAAFSLGVGALATANNIRNSKEFTERVSGHAVEWREGFHVLVAATVLAGVACIFDAFVLLKIREGPKSEAEVAEEVYQAALQPPAVVSPPVPVHPRGAAVTIGTNTDPLPSAVAFGDDVLVADRPVMAGVAMHQPGYVDTFNP